MSGKCLKLWSFVASSQEKLPLKYPSVDGDKLRKIP